MCLILWHRHFPWNSAAVWRIKQEGPSSCVVCSKGKQINNIPAAWNTKEPATSPQVVLEIIYTGLSFQSFLFTIYQVISRNAYYINCCERKGWENISKKFLEEKLSFVSAHVCVCWVLAGVCMHVVCVQCKIDVRNPLLFVLFLEAGSLAQIKSSLMWWAWLTRLSGGHLSPSSRAWVTHHLYRVWGSELWST